LRTGPATNEEHRGVYFTEDYGVFDKYIKGVRREEHVNLLEESSLKKGYQVGGVKRFPREEN